MYLQYSMFCFVWISVVSRHWETEKCHHNKNFQQFWLVIHVNLCYQSKFPTTKSGWDDTYLSNFWYNIKETPDNFNDFSTTKPARCQQVISYSVCSLTFCITLQSEFLSCLQEQSVHLFIYIVCTFYNYIVAQYQIYIKWKQTSEISWLIIHYLSKMVIAS